MPRKTKKQREDDEYMEKVLREAREFYELFEALPPKEGAALSRARSLGRTLKLRYWLKRGNETLNPNDLQRALKHEQSTLLKIRRYRETGIWPELH
jgi:hypothetical protein